MVLIDLKPEYKLLDISHNIMYWCIILSLVTSHSSRWHVQGLKSDNSGFQSPRAAHDSVISMAPDFYLYSMRGKRIDWATCKHLEAW